MIPLRLAEVAAATGGTVDPAYADVVVDGPVVVDSRQVAAGSLFGAVLGERVDGHDFVLDAATRGAAAALVARPVGVTPCVVVRDVVDALGRLATYVLASLREGGVPRVIGITGSSGKTSTKDVVAQVLVRDGEVVAPAGSYNNEIGLPLTVLRASAATRHLVLEMSARGVGHIAALCVVAPVEVGVVLNVGSAHVGEFGSREAIARAKSELLDGIVAGGAAVLNVDDAMVAAMRTRPDVRRIGVGCGETADVRARDVALDAGGRPAFTVVAAQGEGRVRLRLVGAHHVGNALAAVAVGLEAGLSIDVVTDAVSSAVPRSRWRMEMRQTADGVTVINDAYNANPESMRAALEALVLVGRGRRTWAVLGHLAELGEETPAAHAEVGRLCATLGVDHVVAVGELAAGVAESAAAGGVDAVRVDDVDGAVGVLTGRLSDGDVVLVKASRSAGLERVADALAPQRAQKPQNPQKSENPEEAA